LDMNARPAVAILLSLILLAASGPRPASAQDTDPAGRDGMVWLTTGLGVGSEGAAAAVSANIAWEEHVLSARGSATALLFDDGFGDFGLLYGRTAVSENAMLGASAGLGVVDGAHSGSYAAGPTVGIPVSARAAWHPLPVIGLGTYLFGNLNLEQPFAGLVLTVNLGWLQ